MESVLTLSPGIRVFGVLSHDALDVLGEIHEA